VKREPIDVSKFPTENLTMRKFLGLLLTTFLLGTASFAEAQQPGKVPQIGYLSSTSPSAGSFRIEAFRQGLRELGYIEGKNLAIEWRFAEGKLDRLPELAAELVRLKVDIIVSASPPVTGAVKDATVTIPIVMAHDPDPVGNSFVASLARPGGNITGLASFAPELSGKRLELLKEIIPRLARVAVLGYSTEPGFPQVLREIELAAAALKVQFQYLDVLAPKDIETELQAAAKGRADAILVMNSPIFIAHRKQVADLAVRNRLPAIYYSTEFVEEGGLMSYGVSFTDLYRRAPTYVDKILKGRNPADLPVEQPKKFEFVINLKTAKQIGLTIPPNVLARADKVIK
jgi:putative tryptophan/tyrosine transport system substrate-binding protein